MTAALIISICVACLALGLGVGFKVAKAHLEKAASLAIEELSESVVQRGNALQAAQVDVEIVRALREGDLGIEDLHEIGFDEVRQEATGWRPQLRGQEPEIVAEESELAETATARAELGYQPFDPLPYRRDVQFLRNMTPGDEVWIQTVQIMHSRRGDVTLLNSAVCYSAPSEGHRCRLRMLRNGQLELAVDPEDTQEASGAVSDGDRTVKYLTSLRPEDRWRWSGAF